MFKSFFDFLRNEMPKNKYTTQVLNQLSTGLNFPDGTMVVNKIELPRRIERAIEDSANLGRIFRRTFTPHKLVINYMERNIFYREEYVLSIKDRVQFDINIFLGYARDRINVGDRIKAIASGMETVEMPALPDPNLLYLGSRNMSTDDIITAYTENDRRIADLRRATDPTTFEDAAFSYLQENGRRYNGDDFVNYMRGAIDNDYDPLNEAEPIEMVEEFAEVRNVAYADGPWDGENVIKEYEDEFIYIPSSNNCCFKVIKKLYPDVDIGKSDKAVSFREINKKCKEKKIICPDTYKYSEKDQMFKRTNHHVGSTSNFMYFIETKLYRIQHAVLVKGRHVTLEYIHQHIILEKSKSFMTKLRTLPFYEPKESKNYPYFAYDIESYSYKYEETLKNGKVRPSARQIPYGISLIDMQTRVQKQFVGDNCLVELLRYVESFKYKRSILYAYNAGMFDTIMFRFYPEIKSAKIIKNNSIKSLLVYMNKEYEFELRDAKDYFRPLYLEAALDAFRCVNRKTKFDIADFSKEKYDKCEKLACTDLVITKNPENVTENGVKKTVQLVYKWTIEGHKNEKEITEFLSKYNTRSYTYKHSYGTWIDYMRQDTVCLAELIEKMQEYMKKFGCDMRDNLTISAVSWKLLLRGSQILRSRCYIQQDQVLKNFIRKAVYGGRVFDWMRIYKRKEGEKGIISYDANMLYAAAMFKFLFPIDGSIEIKDLDHFNIIRSKRLFYIAELELELPNWRTAKFPYSDGSSLIYPVGKFTGVYCSADIEDGIIDGLKIHSFITGVYWTGKGRPYKDSIQMLHAIRQAMKIAKNPFEVVVKTVANASYGKQLEKNDSKIYINNDPVCKTKHHILRKPKTTRLASGQYEHEVDDIIDYHETKPVHLAVFILAYARHIMNRFMRAIGEENIYYSDTDSMYVKAESMDKIKDFYHDTALGCLKNDYGDGTYITDAIFLDQKRYLLKFNKPHQGDFFKCKFIGLNFKDTKKNFKEYYDKNLYSDFWVQEEKDVGFNENYSAMKKFYMDVYDTYRTGAQSLDTIKKHSLPIKQEIWKRTNNTVEIMICYKEFSLSLDHKGEFIGNLFYPIGYNHNIPTYKPDENREKFCLNEFYQEKRETPNYLVNIKGLQSQKPLIGPAQLYIPIDNKFEISSNIVIGTTAEGKKLYYKHKDICYEINEFGFTNIIENPENQQYVICIMKGGELSKKYTGIEINEEEFKNLKELVNITANYHKNINHRGAPKLRKEISMKIDNILCKTPWRYDEKLLN
jgi:hypothetical protein